MKKNKQKRINQNQLYTFVIALIALIIISLIIYLIVIWRDNTSSISSKIVKDGESIKSQKISSKDISEYIEPASDSIETEAIYTYIYEIINLFNNKDYIGIFNKLDSDYVSINNLSEKNIEAFLVDNNFGPEGASAGLGEVQFYSEGTVYVYRVRFYFGKKIKYINFIEKEPYNYTINLEQNTVPKIVNNDVTLSVDDIQFQIKEEEKREDAIIYSIKVTNNSEEKISFDFTSINSVALAINDGGMVKQPSSILEASTNYSLNPQSYFVKKFYFPINMQYHEDITGFNFYNVKVGNVDKNIYVRF